MKTAVIWVVFFFLAWGTWQPISLVAQTQTIKAPDLILHHGRIVTVNSQFEIVEALAIQGDRIQAAGSNEQILALATESTQQIDLQNRMVLPGLIDSHVHASGAATYEYDHVVPDVQTVEDVLEYIAQRADALEDGQWIRVQQMFITRLAERRFPTRDELDKVAPKNPVVFRTGPDMAVNSLALQQSGVNEQTPLPPGSSGRIERDANGRLTGIIRGESSLIKFSESQKRPTQSEQLELLQQLLQDYNSVGITSISDRNASDRDLELFDELRSQGKLTVRVFIYYGINPDAEPAEITKRIEQLAAHPLHTYNNFLWLRGIKVFLDGGMLTGSAYMRQPWGVSQIYSIIDPEYRGTLKIAPERLFQISRLALSHDLQMTAHSVGDGAVHNLIDAYERCAEELDVAAARPCITHCNFMSAEAIARMQKLGIVADLQPAWLYLDAVTLEKQFGNQRLAYFQPYKSLFEAGVKVGGGSDHMQKVGSFRSINPYNPFLGMSIAVTRLPRGASQPLHPEQCISREDAIRLYTINNAYLSFEEREKGSLEPGKLADFIILDRDLLLCPDQDIATTRVLATYVGGRRVFEQ
ncbi:MAG: amidohydrolase [Planctomycetales bacterium]|nr:amidohydrolase [Planctomycetales bacterium]